jgi:hypothetical protein
LTAAESGGELSGDALVIRHRESPEGFPTGAPV